MSAKKVLLSGVKPTGHIHIGNYFGAIKNFVDLLNGGDYDCKFMVADYHALNSVQSADELRHLTYELVVTYLSVGLDPTRAIIFKQSDVPAHTELAWIFDTITPVPYLMRAHAYKDAVAKDKEINVGTFNYPMLMAADILLYDTDVVPVGNDQKQHIEFARDTAEKFNKIFGHTFTMPEEMIVEDAATVPGTDGQKMSKSYDNIIPLFAPRDEIINRVMSIVTDSSGDRPENVYAVHKLFQEGKQLDAVYEEHRGNYKALKEALIEDIDAFIAPLREQRAQIESNPDEVYAILKSGGEAMRGIAEMKMNEVRKKIGVSK